MYASVGMKRMETEGCVGNHIFLTFWYIYFLVLLQKI